MASKCKCVAIVLAIAGVAFLIAGLVLGPGGYFQKIIDKKVDEEVVLKDGTLVFKNWQKPTSPIFMKYFVFDLKNPQEFFKGQEKPFVMQKGPYSYREIRSNTILKRNHDNTVVTFMPNRTYVFDPETSCKGCNDRADTFTSVNIPLMKMALWLKNTNYTHTHSSICLVTLRALVDTYANSLFQTRSVYEILWGYEDILLEKLIEAIQAVTACGPLPNGTTPLIQLQYNNTYYGISAINTGVKDVDELEQYTMWRESSHLSWWMDRYANMINGTDGTQFKPRIKKDMTLYAFVPEICRSMYIVYDSTIKVRGITLYRFTAPRKLYLSGDIYPPNKAFCVPPGCLPTGLLNVTRCQPQNPPVAMSPPHFYLGNASLHRAVGGLSDPEASEHGTFLDIEPITGITMQARKRIQANVYVQPLNILKQTNSNFTAVFLPVMYASEDAKISEKDAADFRTKVYNQIELAEGVEYGLIALGAVLIIISIVLFCRSHRKDKDEKTPINPGDDKGYSTIDA